MLRDWSTLISWTLYEYSQQQHGGLIVVITIPFFIVGLLWTGCFVLGRLIDTRYYPSISQMISKLMATLLTILAVLLWAGAPYIRPAIAKVIESWKAAYQNDSEWHHETYRQKYWAVKALKGPEGNPVENFDGHLPPESPGSMIPISSAQARHLVATIEVSRVSDHFQLVHPFLERVLGIDEQPLPELLKEDIDNFFQQNPHETVYPIKRGIDLAGNRMLSILEQKLPGIVFRLRLIVALALLITWSPLYVWSAQKAWKNLEPSNKQCR